MSLVSADLLIDTIKEFDKIVPIKQDNSLSLNTSLIKKEDAYIDSIYDSDRVYNMVSAFETWPTCNIDYLDDKMKILKIDNSFDYDIEINALFFSLLIEETFLSNFFLS